MKTKCYEFFGCPKQGCLMFDEKEERNCWELEPAQTQCTNIFIKGSVKMKDKMVFCKNCVYFLLANEATNVASDFKFHNFE